MDAIDRRCCLLTARLTQDCVENLFSCVRSKNPVPTARECKYALKQITVAQYLKPTKSGNYEQDDREFLDDLLPEKIIPPVPEAKVLLDDITVLSSCAAISAYEKDVIYYLAGYCVQSLSKLNQICNTCKVSIKHNEDEAHPHATFLKLKNFKDGSLFEVCDEAFYLFTQWEVIVRSMETYLRLPSIATHITTKCIEHAGLCIPKESALIIPTCHNLLRKLLTKFVNVRLHIMCSKAKVARRSTSAPLGSKSMCMRHIVKSVK